VTGDRPLADLLRDAVQQAQDLFRAEAQLAKAEIRHEAQLAASAAMPMAIGALAAVSAWMLVVWAAVYGLAEVMPLWAATLIMAASSGLLGIALLQTGVRRLKQVRAVPDRTVATMKENLAWIKPSSR
jgi:hypothetical protein